MQAPTTRVPLTWLLLVPGFVVGAYVCASLNAGYAHVFGESYAAPRILVPTVVSLVLAALPFASRRPWVRWAATGAVIGVVLVSLVVAALVSTFGRDDFWTF